MYIKTENTEPLRDKKKEVPTVKKKAISYSQGRNEFPGQRESLRKLLIETGLKIKRCKNTEKCLDREEGHCSLEG